MESVYRCCDALLLSAKADVFFMFERRKFGEGFLIFKRGGLSESLKSNYSFDS